MSDASKTDNQILYTQADATTDYASNQEGRRTAFRLPPKYDDEGKAISTWVVYPTRPKYGLRTKRRPEDVLLVASVARLDAMLLVWHGNLTIFRIEGHFLIRESLCEAILTRNDFCAQSCESLSIPTIYLRTDHYSLRGFDNPTT